MASYFRVYYPLPFRSLSMHLPSTNVVSSKYFSVYCKIKKFGSKKCDHIKRDLIHASNFSTLKICNSAYVWPTALKVDRRLSCCFICIWKKFSLIAYSQMKLCFFKVAKLDVCIRPLFTNPATNLASHAWFIKPTIITVWLHLSICQVVHQPRLLKL